MSPNSPRFKHLRWEFPIKKHTHKKKKNRDLIKKKRNYRLIFKKKVTGFSKH